MEATTLHAELALLKPLRVYVQAHLHANNSNTTDEADASGAATDDVCTGESSEADKNDVIVQYEVPVLQRLGAYGNLDDGIVKRLPGAFRRKVNFCYQHHTTENPPKFKAQFYRLIRNPETDRMMEVLLKSPLTCDSLQDGDLIHARLVPRKAKKRATTPKGCTECEQPV